MEFSIRALFFAPTWDQTMADDAVKDETELEPDDAELDDDEDLDDEFDEDLVAAAVSVGLTAADFDNEDELYRETESRIRKMESETATLEPVPREEELTLAALEVVLKNKDDLDEHLVAALEKLAATSGENFQKLAKRIESGRGGDPAIRKQLEQLSLTVRNLGAQNVQLRLDRWIGRAKDRQTYLGKGDTGELDADSKFARRRRSLTRRADKIAGRQRGDFTMDQMFAKAFKKMRPGSSGSAESKKPDSKATRLARASGSKTTDLVGGGEQSEEAVRSEAADVVRKYKRNAS